MKFLASILCIFLFSHDGLAQTDSAAGPDLNDSAGKIREDPFRLLNPVLVTGPSVLTALKQQPVSIAVIDTKPFYNTNSSGTDLLRQVSGIKVKQDGGFGSKSDFFINGSTGKQVKFFIDGLPQDNMGETQLLNIYPIEQTERIEVYKGVLPLWLGADALGAAINIVTRKEREDYYGASYTVGSFNAHKINLAVKKYFSRHFFADIQANSNYTDNNYRIDAGVPNATGNIDTIQVRHFHDGYKNYNVKLETGFTNISFADQLTLAVISTGLYDQLQNNFMATQPYGKALYTETLVNGILKYQKSNLFKHFNLASAFSYAKVNGRFIDTSKNVYNWQGKVVDRRLTGGELSSSGNDLHIYTDVLNAKASGSYSLGGNINIVFSNTFQYYYRKGKDTVAQAYYGGINYYGTPTSMIKNIAGLGLEGSLLNNRLDFSAALKNYYTKMQGYEIEWATQKITRQSLHAMAYNAAVGYHVTDKLLLKSSYEQAARLPDAEEAFGDFMLIKPNPAIAIEKSENINLNLLYNTDKLEAEISGFYRNVTNIIYLRTVLSGSQYQNLLSVRVYGLEANVRYRPGKNILFNGNITYQDLRNESAIDSSGIDNDRYKNARIPNIPYLFANGGITYKKYDLFRKNTTLQLWWNTTYTQRYFLYWEVDGARDLKNRIPTQFLQHAGIMYSLSGKGLSFSLEADNITDAKTYDNFGVQLPGRSFSFKIRFYQFKKLKT